MASQIPRNSLDVRGVLAIQQGSKCSCGIGLAHQRLADKKRIVPGSAEADDILGGANAALGHRNNVLRHTKRKLQKKVCTDGKGTEVAGIDADKIEPQCDSTLHLLAAVSLAEHVKTHRVGLVAQVAE